MRQFVLFSDRIPWIEDATCPFVHANAFASTLSPELEARSFLLLESSNRTRMFSAGFRIYPALGPDGRAMSESGRIWPLSTAKVALVQTLVQQCPCAFYLVGGYVRDVLMELKPDADLDLVHGPGGSCTWQKVARSQGWKIFVLDAHRGHWRCRWTQETGEVETVDIAPMQGEDIAQDLALRDCSVNAMAVEVATTSETGVIGTLWDPQEGRRDLAQGILRPVAKANLRADPLRLLRVVRLAHTRKFRLQPETLALLKTTHVTLDKTSGERIREEGWRMLLQGRLPLSHGINRLLETRLYKATFCQLDHLDPNLVEDRLPGPVQVFVDGMGQLARADAPSFPTLDLAPAMRSHIEQAASRFLTADYTRRHWWSRLSLLALPLLIRGGIWPTVVQFRAELYREMLPAYWQAVEEHLHHLAFSRVEIRHSLSALRCLDRLILAWQSDQLQCMGIRELHRFIIHSGYTHRVSVLMDTLLMAGMALQGQEGPPDLQAASYWAWQQDAVAMLSRTRFRKPQSLVSGTDLQNWFGLPAGPQVGQLLDQILEAEACLEVSTLQEAKCYLTQLL